MKNSSNKLKPVVSYDNLIECKFTIYKENRNKSAIYR